MRAEAPAAGAERDVETQPVAPAQQVAGREQLDRINLSPDTFQQFCFIRFKIHTSLYHHTEIREQLSYFFTASFYFDS